MAPRSSTPSRNPAGHRPAAGTNPGLRPAPSQGAGRGAFVHWLIRTNDSLIGDAIGVACLAGLLVLGLYAAPILEELMK